MTDNPSETQNSAQPIPKKGMFSSNTFHTAFLTGIGYLGARHFKAPEAVAQTIGVIGVTLTIIFLRRGLIHMLDSAPNFETEADRQKIRKPLYRSMTVVSAILMCAGWISAKFYWHSSEAIINAILVGGMVSCVIFMRRAIMNALG